MKKLFAGLLCGAMLLTASAFAAGDYKVTVDGAALDLGTLAPYEQDGRVMLPLRKVAEALGFTVTWNQETQTASVDDGVVKSSVTIGVDSYYMASSHDIGMSAPQSFGATPILHSDSTYVPTDLFTLLCGQSAVKDGVVALERNGQTQIPNPIKAYDTLAEALAVLDFKPTLPKAPEGYTQGEVCVIGGTLLEVRYHNADKTFTFRAAKGTDDVSGDFSQWDNVITQPEGKVSYTLKGNGDTIFLVLWNDGAVSYALSFAPGVDTETAVSSAKSTIKQ